MLTAMLRISAGIDDDAGVTAEEVDDVVLMGGSTRVYRVRERVAEPFGRLALGDIDPDRVVAIGVAIL
jgi:molecular chaperone HscA